MNFTRAFRAAVVLCSTLTACSGVGPAPDDAGAPDPEDAGGSFDGGTEVDAGVPDAGMFDAGTSCTVAPVTLRHTVTTNTNPLIEHVVDPLTFPQAVCNDGTPAAYVSRAGVGAGARRWILFLEGGGSCGSAAECEARVTTDPGLMTSRGYVEGAVHTSGNDFAGFKSGDPTVNPEFYDANLVLFHYCSSDQWSGARDATSDAGVGRFRFQGRATAEGIVRDLIGKGLGQADEVFLAGSSAGGLGVFNNVDDLRALLPERIRLVAIADAAFGIDYPDFDSSTGLETTARPTPRELDFLAAAVLWGGRGDATCELAATTPLERAACRTPPALLANHFISVPVFVRQSEKDQVQLKMLGAPVPNMIPAMVAYRERFGAEMRRELAATPAPTSVFATYDTKHGTFDTAVYLTDIIDGVAMHTAIATFYQSPCTQVLHIEQP